MAVFREDHARGIPQWRRRSRLLLFGETLLIQVMIEMKDIVIESVRKPLRQRRGVYTEAVRGGVCSKGCFK
jgi:hypothetical protein